MTGHPGPGEREAAEAQQAVPSGPRELGWAGRSSGGLRQLRLQSENPSANQAIAGEGDAECVDSQAEPAGAHPGTLPKPVAENSERWVTAGAPLTLSP